MSVLPKQTYRLPKKKGVPSFDPVAFLSTAGRGRVISKYKKNQKLFSQGDAADSIYFILEGRVKVTVVSATGKEAVVAVLDKQGFCGEGCLSGQPRRMATARAMEESLIARIEKVTLLRAIAGMETVGEPLPSRRWRRRRRGAAPAPERRAPNLVAGPALFITTAAGAASLPDTLGRSHVVVAP